MAGFLRCLYKFKDIIKCETTIHMDGDDEILDLFLEESSEHLDGIENDLLTIEKDGKNINSDLVNKVFRAMHTIKGGSGFFALDKIKDLTHVAEGILDKIRNKNLVPNSLVIQGLLKATDLLNDMIKNPHHMENIDIAECVENLNSCIEDKAETSSKNDQVLITNKLGEVIFSLDAESIASSENMEKGGSNIYLLEYCLIRDIEQQGKTPDEVINDLMQLCYFIESKVDYSKTPTLENFQKADIPFYLLISTVLEKDMAFEFLGLEEDQILCYDTEGKLLKDEEEVSVTIQDYPEEEVHSVVNDFSYDEDFSKAKKPKSHGSENIRVNISLLENLMSLAGELVLARNQLLQSCEHENTEGIHKATQEIDVVTSQLQEAIMKTRMQQIGIVFNKFNRIVRDLSNFLNKEVDLVIEGEDVELDKSIIEKIGDPLTHIVRNSMDHGFETPTEREAAGKPRKGTLLIKAYHEAGKVVIEIVDNGAGIDPEKVGVKAVEKGLISDAEKDRMSDKELCHLIFKPGFSTAQEITELSGRGVGMDVVLTNLTELSGIVDLNSKKGEGTHLKISIPLTLAIMPSLLVSIKNQLYVVPQVNILQILRVSKDDIVEKIQHIGNSLVTRFMNELIPIVRGIDFLNSNPEPIDMNSKTFGYSEAVQILVVASGEKRFGIIIDITLDSPEIVVKPLGKHLKNLPIYTGATILGDGKIAPILDVTGIMNVMDLGNVYFEDKHFHEEDNVKENIDTQSLLIVNNGHEENYAIPLNNVIRIEKIKTENIEYVGSMRTAELLGKSTGIFTISDAANVKPLDLTQNCSVILFETLGKTLGLVVKEIIDSVEIAVEFDEQTYKQPGILGAAYINEQLTLLVDLFGIISHKMPQWVEDTGIHLNEEEKSSSSNILIVDDSPFFLNQINSFLTEAGYKTVTAQNGHEALNLLNSPENDISFVLTDIEMPNMDGWELITEIRKNPKIKEIPIVAITSVAGEHNAEKGRDLGVDEYLLKLDREEILQTIKKYNTLEIV